ncbi:hypothetical protein TWF102_003714 [Orbilia oligospora]|uniref:P-loop containing nucleoside triphosphate hydrolase protein n=1 Tax=Orbilia oligospora TaxID=2813651 RepID=A0A7C8JC08_ORBOL|nr:hypothetical protein TWF102_003714 [Orbilia oligospora]KAF3105222.1 hypothetical protein TWF103_006683 [Orbilia oligospora]
MANATCMEDLGFGPTVLHCRQGLDFTLQFEESMFDLVPAGLVILLAPLRIWQLRRRPKRVFEKSFAGSKLMNIAILAILKLILAIVWTFRAPVLTKTSIAAAVVSFCEVLAIGIVSSHEHVRNIRPSSLLSLALTISIVFDTIRARTFIKINFDNLLTALFTASIASKASVLLLEAKDKRVFLRSPDTEKPPEETSGLFSRSVFWWLTPLLRTGYSKILGFSDLWHLDDRIDAPDVKDHFYQTWLQSYSHSKRKYKLARSSFRALMWLFLSPVIPNILFVGLNFSQPFLISRMITFVRSDDPTEVGYLLLLAFAVVYVLIGVFGAIYWHEVDRWLTVLRGCLVSAIYRKTLTLDLRQTSTGASVALMSTDVEKAMLGFKWLHEAVSSFAIIPIALVLLYFQVGLAFLAPLFILGLCTYLASYMSTIVVKRQKIWLQETQKRVHFTSSVIASMRGVKMMGLVPLITKKIERLRHVENMAGLKWRLNIIVGVALSNLGSEGSKWFTFILYAIIFYVKQSKGDNSQEGLNVNVLFTSLAILNITLQKLQIVIQIIPGLMNSFGCLMRIEEFLMAETKSDNRLQREIRSRVSSNGNGFGDESEGLKSDDQDIPMQRIRRLSRDGAKPLIEVTQLTAGWSQDEKILNDVSLDIISGEMTIIVGPVGCGKSTLLQSLLGETTVHEGFVNIHGPFDSIAYCAQTPWLVNKSIRDNIVGMSLFDVDWYKEVVRCCALLEDLKLYDKGDKTLVGSKGVTLSGGQKQRIALARAVYSRKPILILDDIFSGLDAVTEERIFARLLGPDGLLRKNRNTIILATHAVHRLPSTNQIIVMTKEGSIQSRGTWESLSSDSTFMEILRDATKSETSSTRSGTHHAGINDDQEIPHEVTPHDDENARTQASIDDISRKTGDIMVYKHYFKSIGLKHTIIFGVLLIIESGVWNVLTVWLNKWSSDPDTKKTPFYMGIYTLLVFSFLALLTIWVGHCGRWPMTISAENLHKWQLATMMKGKMSYFSATDVGVTTNRFSQDLVLIDTELPMAMINCTESALLVIGLIAITLVATPWIAMTLPFLAASFYYLQRFYLRTSRQMRLLDIEAKSPLYTHFQETLSGIATIRAFSWEKDFNDESEKLLSVSQKPYYYLATVQRWLALVLDLIVAMLAFAIALIAVQLRHSLNPGYIGLALLNTMSIGEMLKVCIIFYTNLETSLGAIARMRNFSKVVPHEDDPGYDLSTPEWPGRGNVVFDNLSASHKLDSEIVLKGINLTISAGTKVGLCGRSGSGKSSLVATLFRLLEVQGGSITIDGIDVTDVPINTLRGRLNVLSQEPFFLAGTVRENLGYAIVSDEDNDNLQDEDMLEVLDRVGLKEKVLGWEGGLNAEFDPEGSLSHGERQLFCLARAMLKKSNIVVLDEFTSSVDIETDNKMQKILRDQFAGKTVLTVAHRLNTIVDYDRVVVLDKGIILESGRPGDLLRQPGSAFKALYEVHENS